MGSRLVLLAFVSVLLASCGTTSNCAGWSPIYTSKKDTAETRDLATKHNNHGLAQGCPGFIPRN